MGTRLLKTSRSGVQSEGGSADGRIYGRLGSVSLNDVLQLLGMTHRTATLRLNWRGQQGQIFFREGVLLHANAGTAEGERALVKLMSWENADFIIEDGLEGEPPNTISKKVDAVMLDVMTRMDEGWAPEMTPFPMLDRLTTSAAVLDQKVRRAARKPPVPRRAARSKKPIVAGLAATVVLVAGSLALVYQNTDLGELPSFSPVPIAEAAPESGGGIASDVLKAAIEGRRDGINVVAAHGVSLATASEPAGAERSVAEASTGAAAPIADEAPRAPQFGLLLVVAEPWAQVAVDGVERGETPLTEMRLAAGSHEILVSNPNFVGVIRDKVQVNAGETIRRKYSFNESGSVRLLVTPWADVYVDGRHAGQTPLGALRVPPGTHTILLRHPQLGEKTEVVEVFRDRESLLEVEM